MKKIVLIAVALLLLVTPAFADMKVGYVDLQKALNTCKAGQQAKGTISSLVKKYEGEFKAKQQELLELKGNLEKQAALLSADARKEKEREYQQEVKELQRFQKDVKEELQQKDADHTKRILNELFETLKTIGAEGKYTMILEKNEGAVIYADESIDLTAELVKKYDARK